MTYLQKHRPDSEMVTSFLTILYEDLLIGEQVDVHSTVYEGLLIVEQVDVQTSVCTRACSRASRPMSSPTGPLSTVGLIPWNVPALQLLPACGSDVFGTSTRRCSNFSRKRKATRRTRKEGKVARRTREK